MLLCSSDAIVALIYTSYIQVLSLFTEEIKMCIIFFIVHIFYPM